MKSEANTTPKYLHLFTLSNSQLKIDRDNEEILYNFLLLTIDMDLVFERLQVSLFAFRPMLRCRDLHSTCSAARKVLLRSSKEQYRQRTMINRSVQ